MTRYGYGERGQLRTVTEALGNTTSVESNAAGLPVSVTDAVGAVWAFDRDYRNRITAVIDPLGAVVRTQWTSGTRPRLRMFPDGTAESWEWNAQDDLVSHTDQAGFSTVYEIGPFHRISARTDPDGARYDFSHDTELRLTSVAGPHGLVWRYDRDGAGNLTGERDFNGRSLSYGYDPAGRVVGLTNGAGERTELDRDCLGQVSARRSSDGAATAFGYSPAGDLLSATSPDCELTISRDALGRALTETVDGRTLTKVYDLLGRCTRLTTASGRVCTWQYDQLGQPAVLTAGAMEISFGHDLIGQETHRWIGREAAVTAAWDELGRLVSRRLVGVDGPEHARTARLLHEQTWSYRADGVPAAIGDSATGMRHLGLDPLGRVTEVRAATWTEQYAYDALGNLREAGDTRASDNDTSGPRELSGTLLRAAGRSSYTYDAQNRLVRTVRRTLSGQSRAWTYDYDAQDRLIGATNPAGETWRYRYDPLGRRISKQRLGAEGRPVEETRFTWDGAVLVEQDHFQAGLPTVTVTGWTYEPGSWTPVTQDSRTFYAIAPQQLVDERFHAIITDLAGAPAELVTPDGLIQWRRPAGLWGADRPAGLSPAPEDQQVARPLRFPGQYHDPETGLHYNYLRYYDPDTGRYTSPDPLGLAGSPNAHAYVTNPTDLVDPLGLKPKRGPAGPTGPEPRRVYDPGGKHGPEAVQSSRGVNSKELADGQAALDNSTQIKPTSPRRIGTDPANGEIVILDRTRVVPGPEGEPDTEVYHGHVRNWSDMETDQGMDKARGAATRAKLVDKKGNILPCD